MPKQKAVPKRATAEGTAARQREPTYEERIGRALRDMYPDTSTEAYGPIGNHPGYSHPNYGPVSDQQRFDSYTYAQREQAQRYHQAFIRRHILGLVGGDLHAAQFVDYQGHDKPLRYLNGDDLGDFVDSWAVPSAQYARRHRLNPHQEVVAPAAAEPRNARPVRERSPQAGAD